MIHNIVTNRMDTHDKIHNHNNHEKKETKRYNCTKPGDIILFPLLIQLILLHNYLQCTDELVLEQQRLIRVVNDRVKCVEDLVRFVATLRISFRVALFTF